MQHKAIKRGKPEIAYSIFNYIFFTLLCIVMVYPFWHVIMMSLSSVEATAKGGVFLWPKGFNLDTYAKVFNDSTIWLFYDYNGNFVGSLFWNTVYGNYGLSSFQKVSAVFQDDAPSGTLYHAVLRRYDSRLPADEESGPD